MKNSDIFKVLLDLPPGHHLEQDSNVPCFSCLLLIAVSFHAASSEYGSQLGCDFPCLGSCKRDDVNSSLQVSPQEVQMIKIGTTRWPFWVVVKQCHSGKRVCNRSLTALMCWGPILINKVLIELIFIEFHIQI